MSKNPDIPSYDGMREISDLYDAFIIDVWGVLHDGVTLYPGVVDALERLTAAAKPFVMLTNAPRRSAAVADAMISMGMPDSFCRKILSSGEATFLDLKERADVFYASLGNRFMHVGPDRDRNLFDGLDWDEVTRVDECDLIVNTGPWKDGETVADYEKMLQRGVELGLPMICANPDLVVVRGGRKIICAGSLAMHYEDLGGIVRWFGKPRPEIYNYCFRELSDFDKPRIAAVGDSFRTDLAGAANVGVAPIFVAAGIHAEELGGWPPDPDALILLADKWKARPAASIPAFSW
ncbi:MAG: TIGR01459 family HAD-type hydrolase [Pseudomonadota bacterium]|nr:TIGR01459 family HAD-type hydrolase [Pseudomonadota bacterium]